MRLNRPGALPRTPSRRTEGGRRGHAVPHAGGVGGGAGAGALPAPGRGAAGDPVRQQRGAGHADRVGEVAGRHRGAPGGARRGPGLLLHRADQGAGEREVLRVVRGLRRRRRRDAHRRRLGQRRCPDHRVHRGGAGQHRPPRGQRHRRRAGGDGRVPLLRRGGPRLGVAGTAAGAAPGSVPADVGHPRRHVGDRRRPDDTHGPRDRRRRGRRASGAAGLQLVARTPRRHRHRAGRDRSGAGVRRPLHAGGGRRARRPGSWAVVASTRSTGGRRTRSRRRSGRSGSGPASARPCRSW